MDKKLFLAADSGGSKTEWVLIDEDGNTVASMRTNGLGAVREGILPVRETVKEANEKLKVYGQTECIYLSLGGPNTAEVLNALKSVWGCCKIIVEREASGNAMLKAAGMLGAKAVVMCGTGSTAVGDTKDGRKYCGGWGPIYGDGGSGGGLGTDAVRAFLRLIDGLCAESSISDVFAFLLEGLDIREFKDRMELKNRAISLDRRTLASFAPAIYELYSKDDPIATKLYTDAADEIAKMAFCVSDNTADCKILICGGFLRNSPLLVNQIKSEFAKISRAEIIYCKDFNPIIGAKMSALEMGDIEVDKQLFKKLLTEWKEECYE